MSRFVGHLGLCAAFGRRKTATDRCGSWRVLPGKRNKALQPLLRRRNKGEGVSSVYLLRHGAHRDLGHRLTGRADDHGLTDEGRAQAAAAAETLAALPPSAIFTSPRRRTLETAAIVGGRLELCVTETNCLDEIDFGTWTGMRFAELASDPKWHEWNADRSRARCPGGETQIEAQRRALAFAFEVAAKFDEPPLLVTHCDIVRALVCWADRRSLDDIHLVHCEPGSLARLDLVEDMGMAA